MRGLEVIILGLECQEVWKFLEIIVGEAMMKVLIQLVESIIEEAYLWVNVKNL